METHLLLVAVFVVSTLLQLLVSKLLQPALPALSVSGVVPATQVVLTQLVPATQVVVVVAALDVSALAARQPLLTPLSLLSPN